MKVKQNKYPPSSAGRAMTASVPTVDIGMNFAEIRNLLITQKLNFDTINYIYILDKNKKFKGVVSIKEIFRSPQTKKAIELSPAKLISARAHTDQEKVAQLALENNIKAIPVVAQNNIFLGVVPSDMILKILHQEATEDITRFGGITHSASYDDIFELSLINSLKHRFPWLLVGLLGGLLAAGIIGQFEQIISQNLILAAFIPLIVYMADAVGTQMEVFIIRDLAINPKLRFVKYFLRQSSIVLTIGLGISALLYLVSIILYHNPNISFVLSVALFLAISTSLFTGLIIPVLFSKIRIDPANASGPIATIIQDVLSVLLYFIVASLIL